MKIKKNVVLSWYLFVSIVITWMLYIFLNTNYQNINYMVMNTFVINGIIIFINLSVSSEKGYSLNDIFWVFMFTFMFIAPVLQYVNNDFPWWNTYLLTDEILLNTNIYILVFMIIYISIYYIIKNKMSNTFVLKKSKLNNIELLLNIGFIISIFISLYIIIHVGFWDLFSRGTASLGLNQIKSLIVGKSIRSFPFITLVIHLYYKNKYGYFYNRFQLVVVVILFILTHFPSGLPRFQIAAVYIALMLVHIKTFNNKYFFKIAILVGLLILFPLLGVFRHISINTIFNSTIKIFNPIELFLTGDFDAYSMLARSLIYVDFNGITFGKQLLGSLFFFIPRAIWPTKPIGSGAMVGDSFNWQFTNISMPFIGEGYINFGLFGVIIFAVFLGYINSRLDMSYKIKTEISDSISALKIYYPVLIGFLFFILRGDLLSSWAYTVGYFFPVLFFVIIDKILTNIKNN